MKKTLFTIAIAIVATSMLVGCNNDSLEAKAKELIKQKCGSDWSTYKSVQFGHLDTLYTSVEDYVKDYYANNDSIVQDDFLDLENRQNHGIYFSALAEPTHSYFDTNRQIGSIVQSASPSYSYVIKFFDLPRSYFDTTNRQIQIRQLYDSLMIISKMGAKKIAKENLKANYEPKFKGYQMKLSFKSGAWRHDMIYEFDPDLTKITNSYGVSFPSISSYTPKRDKKWKEIAKSAYVISRLFKYLKFIR